ncbi:MAG: DNA polymerase III subunit delta', partial [Geobacter sp.]|nr:DNA polymerase III subunit delta' [Geobacter sp.]
MSFDRIKGNAGSVAAMKRILGSRRIAHAYLFAGPDGVGKKLAAIAFVQSLFCSTGNGCGVCPSCRKIAAGSHPAIHTLEPAGQFIKIDQVRELQKELGYRPYEAPRKVCIIDGADRFNPSSGNALLKTLEEPPGDALLILTTSAVDSVLQTIRSRCQLLWFSSVPVDEITALLVDRGCNPADAAVAAALADGSVARALSLSSDDTISTRAEIMEKACSLDNYSAIFAFGERFDKEREKAVTALDFIISFWRDMLTLSSGSPNTVNSDMTALLAREARKRNSRT